MKDFKLFIIALLLGILVIPIGFMYTILKYLYKPISGFIIYLFYILKQLIKIVEFVFTKTEYSFFLKLSIVVDMLGNVTSGEMFEDIITSKENTLFSNGDYTISAATGKLEIDEQLNAKGIWFTNALSKVFGKNHSIKAYLETLNDQNINNNENKQN